MIAKINIFERFLGLGRYRKTTIKKSRTFAQNYNNEFHN